MNETPTPRTDAIAADNWPGNVECVPAEFAAGLERELTAANQRIAELEKDEKRLDWIESQSDGSAWIARSSTRGSGYRIHNTGKWFTDDPNARGTAREAIDQAMSATKA